MVELEGTYEIAAPRELVWEMVLDPDVLARVMPGCEKLERTGEDEYKGKLRIKVGPVDGVYQGTLKLSQLRPLEGFRLAVNGRGSSGNIRGEGDLQLGLAENGTTLLRYQGQGEVSGRMATVGQRLTQSSARAITKQCLINLDRQVKARMEPPSLVEDGETIDGAQPLRTPAAPEAPSQTDFMVGVAQELKDQYMPNPNQRRMLIGLAALPVLVLFMNWFANLVAKRVVKRLREE